MAEEPQFPPLPDVGDILERKDRFKQKKTAVLKCKECKAKYPREFKEGDYVFSTHRGHYHYLLKGGDTEKLKEFKSNNA